MRIHLIGFLSLLALLIASCGRDEGFSSFTPSDGNDVRYMEGRLPSSETRRVLVYVSAGYNSLSGYLDDNLSTLLQGELPKGKYYSADVLLVLSRKPVRAGDYNTPSAPVLFRIYADQEGTPVCDTLKTWQGEDALCTPEVFADALNYVKDRFPAKGYGMIFSSHALGWLPPNYKVNDTAVWVAPYRSIGQDRKGSDSYELSLEEFADAIPFRMDYLLIDACLMGCVEVAWQLKGKADVVGFSPTEILAKGFDYSTLVSHLFAKEPDPVAVCEDYFNQYGPDGDATITVVDTRRMDGLATVCRQLFAKYRSSIAAITPNQVQRYFRPSATVNCTVLYDLVDILVKAGITVEEQAALEAALDDAILYKATSRHFLSIPIDTYSGLSLYLPPAGNATLDAYYKSHIAWNDATELIQ